VNTAERIERKIGFQSLFDFNDAVEAIEFAAQAGFRAVELNLCNPYYLNQLRSSRERKRIVAASRRNRVAVLGHGIDSVNFIRPDWQHCKANLAFFKRIATDATRAELEVLTFHLGVDMYFGYSANRKHTYEVYPELFAENLRRVLAELREFSRDKVLLGVENVGGFRYPWVFPIVHKALGGRLGLTMDVGHISVYKGKVKEVEEDFFKQHRRFIRSSHLHDNDGKWDMHDVIGNGKIDFLPYLRMLAAQNAWCIFEVRPRESAVECLRRFREHLAPRLQDSTTKARRKPW
jgi:sugar phosphate isomerase/epimerase